jgi:dienelactone hydrolase
VLADFPQFINSQYHYVIYSHGRIVEGDDPMPVHDDWGTYDFPAIKKELAEGSDFVLIAHHRPSNTDVDTYVEALTSWVLQLVENDVDPRHITLVGFSKGGEMTALAASALEPLAINTVLLGTCWPGGVQDRKNITMRGRLLSIYETSDMAKSCSAVAERSDKLSSFQELVISTGKEHGAFFQPLAEWMTPLKQWMQNGAVE